MGRAEEYPEKHLKLPRWLWWVKTEITVRPYSEECFIESWERVLGAERRTVNSKAHWVTGGILVTSFFIAWTIFIIWLFVTLGVWWAGLLIEILNCLVFLPSIVVFFWSLSPPD